MNVSAIFKTVIPPINLKCLFLCYSVLLNVKLVANKIQCHPGNGKNTCLTLVEHPTT